MNSMIYTIEKYSYISNENFLLPDVKYEERTEPWQGSTWDYKYITCYPYIICSGGTVIETFIVHMIDPTDNKVKHCISEGNYIKYGPWEQDIDKINIRMKEACLIYRQYCNEQKVIESEKEKLEEKAKEDNLLKIYAFYNSKEDEIKNNIQKVKNSEKQFYECL